MSMFIKSKQIDLRSVSQSSDPKNFVLYIRKLPLAGALQEKLSLAILQYLPENICVGVSS